MSILLCLVVVMAPAVAGGVAQDPTTWRDERPVG
jgi:hypothetical protein